MTDQLEVPGAPSTLAVLAGAPWILDDPEGGQSLVELWRDVTGVDHIRVARRWHRGDVWGPPAWATPTADMDAGAIRFRVLGDPTPQGSKRAGITPNGRPVLRESSGAKLARWRSDVAVAAEAARRPGSPPLDGPLDVTAVFRFTMPHARPALLRRIGMCWRSSAPDLDKLLRSLFDGMKAGGLIHDDARIVRVDAMKLEVAAGWTGAAVTVRRLTP